MYNTSDEFERDGVTYTHCLQCKKEIIATKSNKCLSCYEKKRELMEYGTSGELAYARRSIFS